MTWQSFKTGLAYPVLVSLSRRSLPRASSLPTILRITGNFLGGDRQVTRWGGQLLRLLGVHSEQWDYYQLTTSRRVAADPHRWQYDHRACSAGPGRRAVGE